MGGLKDGKIDIVVGIFQCYETMNSRSGKGGLDSVFCGCTLH